MATNGKCLFVTQALADRAEEGIPISELEYDDDVICSVDLGTDWEAINYFFEVYSDELGCRSYMHEEELGGSPIDCGDGTAYFIPYEMLEDLTDAVGEITEDDFVNCLDLADMQDNGIALSVDEEGFDDYCESVWEAFQELQAAFEDAATQAAGCLFCIS